MAAVEHAAVEHFLVVELARPQGWVRLSVADGTAVRGSTTGTDGSVRSDTRRADRTAPGANQVCSALQPATPLHEAPQLDPGDIEHLVFAVNEAVTNAMTHGRPPARIRVWTAPDRMVATVSDRGDGPADPFVGLLPLADITSAGLGLRLTHQLCSHVTLDTTDHGFTIRVVVGTPQPGRSGHASDNE